MNYKQVDTALGFLFTNNTNLIVLQVPDYKDIELIVDYLNKLIGYPTNYRYYELVYGIKRIKFEVLGDKGMSYGYRPNQLFFIDRAKDRSYYSNLEVVP